MRRLGHVLLRIFVAAAIVTLAALIAAVMVVRSGWFRERVRERIVAELETTGGRAEIASFRFDWKRLTATVSGVVLHGHEPAGERPLLEARSVVLGLRVISLLERRFDLSYLRIEQPQVRIVFYPDGSNNLLVKQGNWADDLLDLAIARYEIVDGVVDYDQQRIPLNVRGEHLRAEMRYEGSRYRGELASRGVRVMTAGAAPMGVDVTAQFAIDRGGIDLTSVRAAIRDSRVELSGRLNDPRSPHGTLRLRGTTAIRDVGDVVELPIAPTGSASFDGQMEFSLDEIALSGRLAARGIGYARDRIKIDGADFTTDVRLTRGGLTAAAITAHAMGGTITGTAEVRDWRELYFDGNVEGLTVRQAAAVVTARAIPWDGAIDAKVAIDPASIRAAATITRLSDGTPIEGQVEATYERASGKIALENSWVATRATRVVASGVLGEVLRVSAQSTDLNDLLPALAIAQTNAPSQLPVKLVNGRAAFEGRVSGDLANPRAVGQVTATNATVEGHAIDRFSGDVDATRESVKVTKAAVARGETVVEGSAEYARNAIAAALNFRGASIGELAQEAGVKLAVTGTASGTAAVSGSVEHPVADVMFEVMKPAGFGEQLDWLRAKVHYAGDTIAVSGGDAKMGAGAATFQGEYQHRAGDWKTGEASLAFAVQGMMLSSVKAFANLESGVDAKIGGKGNVAAQIANGEVELRAMEADVDAGGVRWNKQSFGDVSLAARTRGGEMTVQGAAKVQDVSIRAQGSWKLAGEMPGAAAIQLSRANLAVVHSVLMSGGPLENTTLPFEGFIDGASAAIDVALRRPRDFHAVLQADAIEIHPKPTQTLRLGVQAQDVLLRSARPVVIDVTAKEARIRAAQFAGRDTSLEATGAVSFSSRGGSDLNVRGAVNLIILQLLNPDLVARGSATVQASVRGSLRDPQVSGRMELKNASLYLGDLPNGVDNANGALVFDRNRATIEKLTAETGGGRVNFAGFIGFGTPLVYRLQATVEKVRVRYPEDVSVTFDATLALNGTSDASTVSGLVTLTKASFTPRADLARVLAQSTTPLPASATSSEYLRGMQFDVRIESGPGFALETSLARNLEAAVDLRLRGTPLRPALLGTASVNEGEVQMFGNRYTVNRGDIRFVNAVKIDPIFDMELETHARGVTVNISISGTMEKMNVNYSSDPPMQPREIIALLAVGRSPEDVAAGLNPDQYSSSSSSLSEAGGGLISEAITAQLSSRLQRFFGSSRVKIDPTLTGADYLPQARLTFEQQVSNDITLTYITNLNRTQEQIVQIEYDFGQRWSAIATREANGLFGIDFEYKRRFK